MTGVVLAAGRSTRTGQPYPKVLLTLNDRPVVRYVIDASRQAGLTRIIVVVGFGRELVEQALAGCGVEFAVQHEQRGTADAVLSCENLLAAGEDVVVLSGDVPLVSAVTIRGLIERHQREKADVTLLTATVADPRGYGRIIRDGGRIVDVIEEKDATEAQRSIREMNVGLYVMRWGQVESLLKQIEPSGKTGEYYLPKVVKLVAGGGGKVCSVATEHHSEFMGINTLVEHRQVEDEFKKRGQP
jgi:UDP-N-acetylglucosamine diphosphorylase/glucosamine-1-phosphate N-acetyltransferase